MNIRPHIKLHNDLKNMIESKSYTGDELLDFLQKAYPIYHKAYPNLRTLKHRLTDIRRLIKLHYPHDIYIKSTHSKYFNLSLEERNKVIDEYKKYVLNNNMDKIQIDINDIIETMKKLVKSNNVYDRVLLLLLVSGCRPIEIFHKNEFSIIEGKPYFIRISNLAKKRDTDISTIRPLIMMTGQDFIKNIDYIRSKFIGKIIIDKKNNDKLASDKNLTLNRRLLKTFPWIKDISIRNKSSLLRKIYAEISWNLHADKSKVNKNVYLSKILSHSGILTSFSYSILNIDNIEPDQFRFLKNEEKQNTELKANRKMTDLEKINILKNITIELQKKGIKITNKSLRGYGVGSKIVNMFYKDFISRQYS